jgi:hypothetical protein
MADAWPLWMSLETLARALDVTPKQARRLVDMGYLPQPEIIGDVERFSRAAVDESIRGRGQPRENRDDADPYSQGVANAAHQLTALRLPREAEGGVNTTIIRMLYLPNPT